VFSRCFEPLYLKNCWTYQNEHGSIRSSSAPFFCVSVHAKAAAFTIHLARKDELK